MKMKPKSKKTHMSLKSSGSPTQKMLSGKLGNKEAVSKKGAKKVVKKVKKY